MIPLVFLVDDVGERLSPRLGWFEVDNAKRKVGLGVQTSASDLVSSCGHYPLPLQEHILKPRDGCLPLDSLLSTVIGFHEPKNPRTMLIVE